MKKVLSIMCAMFMGAHGADAKTLVAYYSRSGNTRQVAEIIRNATGADIFEITTADPNHYPTEYRAATTAASAEIESGNFPAIGAVPDLAEYDTVFVGTPCWWGTMAGPVHTFLADADMSGKTVIPFNTHEGSGGGTIARDVAALAPMATHLRGIAIRGSGVADAADTVKTWLTEIGK